MSQWTFLTNHAQVLLAIVRNPDQTAREIAHEVGITERAVQRLIRDLAQHGYITHERQGRNNHYVVHFERPMRHPAQEGRSIRELVDLLIPLTPKAGEHPHDA
jgi:predicted ArsR family transcriptional regulator